MHLIRAVAEGFNEECLDEAMAAHHRKGDRQPLLRQGDRPVGGVGEVALLGELADRVEAVDRRTPTLAATVVAVTASSDHSPRVHTALRF